MNKPPVFLPARAVSVLVQMPMHHAVVGIPGTVKTAYMKMVSNQLREAYGEFAFEHWVGSQMQEQDIAGMNVPDMQAGVMRQIPLEPVARLRDCSRGLAFFDEGNCTTRAVGTSLMSFIQDGVAGSTVVSDLVCRSMALNPTWCSADAREFSPPEANRLVFIPWDAKDPAYKAALRDFDHGGLGLGHSFQRLPDEWRQHIPRARALVSAFKTAFPKLTDERSMRTDDDDWDDGSEDRDVKKYANMAWPSQRSLTNMADCLAAVLALGEDLMGPLAVMFVKGAVGHTAFEEWRGWLTTLQFPDAYSLLADPAKACEVVSKAPPHHKRLILDSIAGVAILETDDVVTKWNTAWEILGEVLATEPDTAQGAAQILAANKPRGAGIPDQAATLYHLAKRTRNT